MNDPLERLVGLRVIEPVVTPSRLPPFKGRAHDNPADREEAAEFGNVPTLERSGGSERGVDAGDGQYGLVEAGPVPEDAGERRHLPLEPVPQLRHRQLAFFTAVIAR